ncbi:hypothetical protein NBRC116188_18960 [Oceaniserpentilla sp. 4NH20-0058]|uniref:hypothetical protein n=1 Tax=Oceaniserpentilla sp. 4NH20-0058 TaxID=3127660 RepID=UPI00310230E1
MKKQNLLATAILGATLVGCGSDSDSKDPKDLSFATCNEETKICTLEGTMTENYTLTADYEYRLSGVLQVGEGNETLATADDVAAAKDAGVTLTIEPGVHVRANSDGVLLVTRGSKLMAEGTAADPITFSSKQDDDFDGLGEWGGVVVQGFAPQYGAGNTGICGTEVCNVEGEGGDFIRMFGGIDAADNSGVIKYVRIAEAGKVAGPNKEINGLTLMGVGHGTVIDYVQVHGNLDDGIEWFGGTVNVTHAVLTNNDDDAIDFDEGYKGNIQYAIVVQNQDAEATPVGSNDPRGIEANSSDEDFVPQTDATLANITVVNGPIADGEPGIRLRGSVNVELVNSVVAADALNNGCIRIDDSDHDGDSKLSDGSSNPNATDKIDTPIHLVNVIASGCDTTFPKSDPESQSGLVEEVATFDTAWALTNTSATLSSAPTINAVDNGSGFTFEATTYIGAVEPGTAAASAWYAGWIIEGSL